MNEKILIERLRQKCGSRIVAESRCLESADTLEAQAAEIQRLRTTLAALEAELAALREQEP